MKDIDFKIFFELHQKHLRHDIDKNPDYNVLHLGFNDKNIQDHKVLKNALEHLNIYSRPKTMEDLYIALGINSGNFSDHSEIHSWSKNIEQYDLVFNVEDSAKFFDQVKYFESLYQVVKPGGYIISVVPYNSIFEKTFYSYNPAFFGYIAEHFNYGIELAYLGNLDSNIMKSVDLSSKFRDDKYLKNYRINAFWLPIEGMRGPIFLGVVFRKKGRSDDTNSDPNDQIEVQD